MPFKPKALAAGAVVALAVVAAAYYVRRRAAKASGIAIAVQFPTASTGLDPNYGAATVQVTGGGATAAYAGGQTFTAKPGVTYTLTARWSPTSWPSRGYAFSHWVVSAGAPNIQFSSGTGSPTATLLYTGGPVAPWGGAAPPGVSLTVSFAVVPKVTIAASTRIVGAETALSRDAYIFPSIAGVSGREPLGATETWLDPLNTVPAEGLTLTATAPTAVGYAFTFGGWSFKPSNVAGDLTKPTFTFPRASLPLSNITAVATWTAQPSAR